MSAAGNVSKAAQHELGVDFEGELIGPADTTYDEARALFTR
jgi:hypothetical protein